MSKVKIEILPLVGLPDLKFGDTTEQAEYIFGKPEETDELEDEDGPGTIVYSYWDIGINMFFRKAEKPYLVALETDNLQTILLEKKVFKLNEKALTELMFSQKQFDYESEMEEWGEKRFTWEAWNIDFYYEGKEIATINWSADLDENE